MKIIVGATGLLISAATFLHNYQIEHNERQKYAVEYDTEEELYIIDLNKPFDKEYPLSARRLTRVG